MAVSAQCLMTDLYPGNAVPAPSTSAVVEISTCNWQTEYSQISGIMAGTSYEFAATLNTYITVREGTVNGNVLAHGYSPLVITANSTDDLFVHWTADDQCATASNCIITTVRRLCPSVSAVPVDDCDNGTFSVLVNVSDLGEAGAVILSYAVNDDPYTMHGIVGVGEVIIGPFAITDVVDVLAENDVDPLCNTEVFDIITTGLCPIEVDCAASSPLQQSYCYTNSDSRQWIYEGTDPGQSLAMVFSQGTIEASWSDMLTIYDGMDNSGPILFQHTLFNDVDLAGLMVVATSGTIYMEMSSDQWWGSCGDGNYQEWQWTVQCLDCQAPTASFSVVTDCVAQEFMVNVNITDMGSDPQLEIANSAGLPSIMASAAGSYQVGPFPVAVPVVVTLVNDYSDLCNLASAPLVNDWCPITINCDNGIPLDQTYCYENNDSQEWLYTSQPPGQTLALYFEQGSIESATWDHITIYDGTDNTGTVLFNHTQASQLNLAELLAVASSGSIYMTMTSDGSNSCSSNGQTQWIWSVQCLDCSAPTVGFSVVLDCENEQFFVEANFTSLGSDDAIDLMNTGGAPPQNVTAPGVYSVGPFELGQTVMVTAENDQNALCSVASPLLTNSVCPVVSCGPDNYSFCYTNYMDTTMVFQSDSDFPIAIVFNSGQIESCCDYFSIYDGPTPSSTPLAQNFNNGGDMTGVFYASSQTTAGPQNALTVVFHSDVSVNCQVNGYTPISYTVACLDCTNPEASYTVVPDCIHQTFSIQLNVPNTGTSSTVRVANSLNTDTLENVPQGVSMVGPFPMNSQVVLTVLNATNDLCRVFSPSLTYSTADCVIPSCSAAGYEYCYANSDTAWFVYQSSTSEPLTIGFQWGELLVNDYIQVFDGLDANAPIIFMGNLGGDMSGYAINSTNGANAICMRIISNFSGSCSDGAASSMYWVVECGEVGVDELSTGDFDLFPNPSNGQVFLRMGGVTQGAMELRVADLTGRVVYTDRVAPMQHSTQVLELGNLASGTYVVTLNGSDWLRTKQLQIVR